MNLKNNVLKGRCVYLVFYFLFSISPQVPYEMVELYNGSVVHLARVAADSRLQQVSWPPTEFSHTNDGMSSLTFFFFFFYHSLCD